MIQPEESKTIEKGMRSLWVIWAAMLGSLFIYILVCHRLGEGFKGTGTTDVPIPVDLLKKIFFGLAVGVLITSYYLRRFSLKARSEAARKLWPDGLP